MKKLTLLILLTLLINLQAAKEIDIGLSGDFFRLGIAYNKQLSNSLQLNSSLGLLPLPPVTAGWDFYLNFRYAFIYADFYSIGMEPLTKVAEGARIRGATVGFGIYSQIGENNNIWFSIKLVADGYVSLGDSLTARFDGVSKYQLVSRFWEDNGLFSLGYEREFEPYSLTIEITHAYSKAEYIRTKNSAKERGKTNYPFIRIGFRLPLDNSD